MRQRGKCMEKDYILNDEEILLIEKFREEQEEIDRKVKYFNFLSIQEDIENKTEFISIRTSLFKFLTKVFSIYHRWCDENNVCYFCSLNMMIERAHQDCISRQNIEKDPIRNDSCSESLH